MHFIQFISFNKSMQTFCNSVKGIVVLVAQRCLNHVCLLRHPLKTSKLWSEAPAFTNIKQQHCRIWKKWAHYLWWHEIQEEMMLCVPTAGVWGCWLPNMSSPLPDAPTDGTGVWREQGDVCCFTQHLLTALSPGPDSSLIHQCKCFPFFEYLIKNSFK